MEAVADLGALDESGLVRSALTGEAQALRAIMQRHNRRLYRVARGILGNDAEAEDAVQEAYLQAFSHLKDFRGEARLSTWLTRIVINEALGRVRRRRDVVELGRLDRMADQPAQVLLFPGAPDPGDPEEEAGRAQFRRLLEHAVDGLPPDFRSVFMMRDIEEMSVEETAAQLGLNPATVKTRLHRARRLLRQALAAQFVSTLKDAFPFDGRRCGRLTERVLRRWREAQG